MTIIHKIIVFICIFALFYFENIYVSGLKISLIWKFALIFGLAISISLRILPSPWFVILAYIFIIKSLIVVGIFEYPAQTILPIIGWLTLPIIFQALQTYIFNIPIKGTINYRYQLNKSRLANVDSAFRNILIFIAISCIPFWAGLKSPSTGKSLEFLGFNTDIFMSFFQNMHGAAAAFAVTAVSLLFLARREEKTPYKYFLYFCFFITTVALFQTYVRTGLLMFVTGLVVISIAEFKQNKFQALLFTLIIFIILSVSVIFNDALMARLFERVEDLGVGYGDYRDLGSGRLLFWETNLNNLFSQDIWKVFIGFGSGLSKKLMFASIGSSVFSHNGFIDALVLAGLYFLLQLTVLVFYL